MKVQRGSYGYLRNRKRNALIGVIAMAAAGIAVFITGLLLNDMSNQNVFTIAAVLFVLPGAKFLVRFIVAFPYHPADRQAYDRVKEHSDGKLQVYADMLVTSPEKVMYLEFIVIGSRHVIALAGSKKQDIPYIRKYLSDGVNNWGDSYKVKVLDNEKSFLREIDSIKVQDVNKEEEQKVKSYIISLVV